MKNLDKLAAQEYTCTDEILKNLPEDDVEFHALNIIIMLAKKETGLQFLSIIDKHEIGIDNGNADN